MKLHSTLPFVSPEFYYFLAIVVALFLIVKVGFKKLIPYKLLLTLVTISFVAILCPKPIQFAFLILYLYFSVLLLKKFYKHENIIFPMLVLSLPMIFMKSLGVFPDDTESKIILKARDIIQIIGLSYIIFKVIGLYIDERRSQTKIKFVDFFNFAAFVPTLLIGPLDRFQRFNSDVAKGYENITSDLFFKGWDSFIKGLLYKFIIAEALHRLILAHLVDDDSVIYHLTYMYTYLFYLFFDFAGYSLLAIGFGNFIGINVPINFDKPFLAVNPKEFWKRWHKTLGDWLNDYFFKPIFKYFTTKQILTSIQRQGIALFLTFTLMGFWNGFKLHYVLSGMLFGFYSVLHNYYIYRCKKANKDVVFGKMNATVIKIISLLLMFNSVAFAIYLFSGKIL